MIHPYSKKRICTVLLASLLALSPVGCNEQASQPTPAPESESTADSTTIQEQKEPVVMLEITTPGKRKSNFRLFYNTKASSPLTKEAEMLCGMIANYTDAKINVMDAARSHDYEIILCDGGRPEGNDLAQGLKQGEYAIQVRPKGQGWQIYLAATTYRSYVAAVEFLLDHYYSAESGLRIPSDLNVTGNENASYTLITSSIPYLRDPCVLEVDGVYYVYGTNWECYKNSTGSLKDGWLKINLRVQLSNDARDGGDHWAPEVHAYNGYYYMFTTYRNKENGNRHGCTILRADSPEGPFVEITNGTITPPEWDAIDGTLYVDPDGQPWMIFVREWVSAPNNVGTFVAAKLSKDLTQLISEPFELFKSDEPTWATMSVTDGCWMYTTKEGELLMLWSNFDELGYCVAVARSSNGRLDGEWIHEDRLLYSRYMTGRYDGGHSMIFKDATGQAYLSFHSPNQTENGRNERAVFLAIKEQDGKLVWDYDH